MWTADVRRVPRGDGRVEAGTSDDSRFAARFAELLMED